jgi:transcriptional regulator with XRE-family HTH domain
MATPQSPIGSRRRLGAELRRLRTKAGLTLDEVADLMTCSTSKISRLETGKGIPKVPDVRELMRIYGVASDTERDMLLRLVRDGRQHGWWEALTDGLAPERFVMDVPGRYAALESDASAVRSFDLTVVHGLLQTEDYVRAVISPLLPGRSADDVERLVALRVKRQEALHRTDPAPLALVAVLDEAVLRRPVGGPAVMGPQLERILEMSELPHVTIQVMPFSAGMLRAHAGHFVLLEIPESLGSDVVYIEGHAGETYLDGPSDVDLYKDVFADVLRYALPPDASREVIGRYLVHHTLPRKAAPP